MSARPAPLKRGNASDWTAGRIGELSVDEIKRLRDNAERLNEPALVELCLAALQQARSSRGRALRTAGPATRASRLVARVKAFEMRGVFLTDPRTSWGGVRKADGKVVMALWADGVESVDGGCRYRLWAPNVDGSHPWSDKPGGRERIDHCRQAIDDGGAEGLLVYGQPLSSHQPEDKAYAIHGADPETVLAFSVEKVGNEFWAKWGARAAG